MPITYCECGDRAWRNGKCADCLGLERGNVPTPRQIEAMKLAIRRENGHDPKQPRLFAAPRS
jgi:hypothetical protein